MIKLPTLLLCPLALICALEMAYAQSFLPQSSTQSPDATQALIPEAERAVQNLNIDVNNGQLTLSWTAVRPPFLTGSIPALLRRVIPAPISPVAIAV